MQLKRSRFTIDSLKILTDIRTFIRESALELGANQNHTEDLILAVNEATTNIFIHGFNHQPCVVDVIVEYVDPILTVSTLDNGPKFDPTNASTPNISAPLENRRPGGLGILMIREYTDQFKYRRTENEQNKLVFKIGEKNGH